MIYANKQNQPGGEYMIAENAPDVKAEISGIEITDDCLTDRAGMAGFSKYLRTIGITAILTKTFSFLKKAKKGLGSGRCSISFSVTFLTGRVFT
jgi:hypothetical protein